MNEESEDFNLLNFLFGLPSFLVKLNAWRNLLPGKKGEPATRILIIGAGGVGKTTLQKVLNCTFDTQYETTDRLRESIDVEEAYDHSENRYFINLPGQKFRREGTWEKHLDDLAENKIAGVIIVNAGGFHEIRGEYQSERQFQEIDDESKFLNAFVREKLKDELEILETLAPIIKKRTKKLWILNVILKQDLWYSERTKMTDLYQGDGEYAKRMKNLREHYPLLKVETEFGCLVIANFSDGNKKLIKKTTAGYEQNTAVRSLERILGKISGLIEWSNNGYE
ncbi:hypothetical protein N9Y42_08435 [Mariniblastus sp.]|nr:hypothetical protein [Mariniblastus sp.]